MRKILIIAAILAFTVAAFGQTNKFRNVEVTKNLTVQDTVKTSLIYNKTGSLTQGIYVSNILGLGISGTANFYNNTLNGDIYTHLVGDLTGLGFRRSIWSAIYNSSIQRQYGMLIDTTRILFTFQPDNVHTSYTLFLGSETARPHGFSMHRTTAGAFVELMHVDSIGNLSVARELQAGTFYYTTCSDTVASDRTVSFDCQNIVITGTADIDSIVPPSVPNFAVVYIEFTGTAATNGVIDGRNLKLNGNFAYSPDDMMVLQRKGDYFYEISRSAN